MAGLREFKNWATIELMNTYLVVLILTFLNTLIALLGYPFPYWFDKWFVVLSGVVILSLLIRKAMQKSARVAERERAQAEAIKTTEEPVYEESNEAA